MRGGGDGNGTTSSGNVAAAPAVTLAVAPFLNKTYDMVNDPSTDSIVSWGQNGNSFVVWNDAECATNLLPKFFKHKNFSSFVRQLNTYGFRKIDSDRWEFANEGFLKGQKHLLKSITRRKSAAAQSQQQQQLAQVQPQSTYSAASPAIEVVKCGIEGDVESLKKDKNIVMQELARLTHQQQATDHQIQSVGQRVQLMEQRQQRLISFLAKAMRSPGFLSQLLHTQNDSNRRITGGNKKRRFPKQEEEVVVNKYTSPPSPDGRTVKYQVLMNEAAKAMLRQIRKMNASSPGNGSGFLIDGVPSISNAANSSSRITEFTQSELPPLEPVVPLSQSPVTISEPLYSHCLPSFEPPLAQFSETNGHSTEEGSLLSGFPEMQKTVPGDTIEDPSTIFMGSDVENMNYNMDDVAIPVVAEEFTSEPDTDMLPDEDPLPGINDVFWEQFLHTDNIDVNNCVSLEGFGDEEELLAEMENGWDRNQHMYHLTEQMGLLASESAVF